MKKKINFLLLMSLFVTLPMTGANTFHRPIVLDFVTNALTPILPPPPPISPFSLNNPLPCDIEAYQTESGVEIIVNDVALVGLYHVYVFDHHHGEIVYSNTFFWQDGSTSFISTATWPDDTYTLYIAIPGGWLEGEFEIE